jgi:beta-fructofuranosidase
MSNSDFTSRAPQYQFATTLAEQRAQLIDNPLLQRMREARKSMASDQHRPIFHYVNPENILNDPNGLCYWNGLWHLFYQGYPPEDPRQHWGHAISEDLVHWQDLPYAIYPNPEECCFSGATLVEKDRVIAMYHGTQSGNMVAVSSDPLLLNWEKLTGKAVIPIPKQDGAPQAYTVFDPCIWEKDGMYYALSGGTLPNGPGGSRVAADFLFRSKDLVHWEYLHPFIEGDIFTLVGDDGACPYFWPIGDRHILLFFSHMSGGQYLLGDYDVQNDKFLVTSGGLFNFGASTPSGVHAPSATPDGLGGITAIFNMNHGMQTTGWDQIMTLPRALSLTSKDALSIKPAGDIESLRYDHKHINHTMLPANQEIILDAIEGNSMEIIAEIDAKSAPMVELNLLRSPNKEEFTRIAFFKDRGFRKPKIAASTLGASLASGNPVIARSGGSRPEWIRDSLLTIDSSYSSALPGALSRAPETTPINLDPEEPLRLRIFVDKSVIEVFVNEKACVAVRVYPGRSDSIGVSLRAQGDKAELLSLDAWQMQNIYE